MGFGKSKSDDIEYLRTSAQKFVNQFLAADDRDGLIELIKAGYCFVGLQVDGRYYFLPTKELVVRQAKSISSSGKNVWGNRSAKFIESLLGPHSQDPYVERRFRAFCDEYGIEIGVRPKRPLKLWLLEGGTRIDYDASRADEIANLAEYLESEDIPITEAIAIIKTRIGQSKFRNELISVNKSCMITGCVLEPMLRASHIVGWAESEGNARKDPANGLLLTANIDALFDRHLISFDRNGVIMVSDLARPHLFEAGLKPDTKIVLSPERERFMNKHRLAFERKIARESGD